MHTKDEDCAPFLVTDASGAVACKVCGVDHGDTCPECNGHGFHRPDCSEYERT